MDGVAFEAEAHQEGVDAQDALEVRQDGDGASAAGGDGLDAVDIGHGLRGGLVAFGGDGDEEAVAALAAYYIDLHIFRGDGAEVVLEELGDLFGGLVRDQPHRDFGVGCRW